MAGGVQKFRRVLRLGSMAGTGGNVYMQQLRAIAGRCRYDEKRHLLGLPRGEVWDAGARGCMTKKHRLGIVLLFVSAIATIWMRTSDNAGLTYIVALSFVIGFSFVYGVRFLAADD